MIKKDTNKWIDISYGMPKTVWLETLKSLDTSNSKIKYYSIASNPNDYIYNIVDSSYPDERRIIYKRVETDSILNIIDYFENIIYTPYEFKILGILLNNVQESRHWHTKTYFRKYIYTLRNNNLITKYYSRKTKKAL